MFIKNLLRECRDHINLIYFQEKWRQKNQRNGTKAGTIFPLSVVSVGDHTYGTLNIHYFHQKEEKCSIGSYCSIADGVHFLLGGEHNYKTFSTFPFKNRVTKNKITEAISRGPITIGDDVWIGYNAIILSGANIGQGVVIGAGSIVRGNVPPYAIFAGGRIIKYRFSEKIRNVLKNFDYSKINWGG